MPGKRDYVTEIKAYVKRSTLAAEAGTSDRDFARLNDVISTFAAITKFSDENIRDELRRHVVVSLVAVIQASARRTIAQIVDGKENRGEELPELPQLKITLATVRELKKRAFSIGELVAHFLSLTGFEQISSALKHVGGQDLNDALLHRFQDHSRPIYDGLQKPEDALATARARAVSLFNYRNIYCHEDGIGVSVKDKELYQFIITTITVVSALGLLQAKMGEVV
jgi:hypothetical protein